MTPDVREEFLRLLSLGQSPQVICHTLGVASADFFATARDDESFAHAMEQAQSLKSRNVESLLYRKALEGNVPAMTQYLKLAPPPDWDHHNEHEHHRGNHPADTTNLARLTLAELRDVAESLRDVAGRIANGDSPAAGLHPAGTSNEPPVLPPAHSPS